MNNDGSKCMSGSTSDTFSMEMANNNDDPTDEDKERIIAMFSSAA